LPNKFCFAAKASHLLFIGFYGSLKVTPFSTRIHPIVPLFSFVVILIFSVNNSVEAAELEHDIEQLQTARYFEQHKEGQHINHAILIYEQLQKSTQDEVVMIASVRLARVYIQHPELFNHYKKAIEQLNFLEQNAQPSYQVFAYYMLAVMHTQGFGMQVNYRKAIKYLKKYQQLLQLENGQSSLKISNYLKDIAIMSPTKLKQKIQYSIIENSSGIENLSMSNYLHNNEFCNQSMANPLCYRPSESIYD